MNSTDGSVFSFYLFNQYVYELMNSYPCKSLKVSNLLRTHAVQPSKIYSFQYWLDFHYVKCLADSQNSMTAKEIPFDGQLNRKFTDIFALNTGYYIIKSEICQFCRLELPYCVYFQASSDQVCHCLTFVKFDWLALKCTQYGMYMSLMLSNTFPSSQIG